MSLQKRRAVIKKVENSLHLTINKQSILCYVSQPIKAVNYTEL